MTVLNFIFRMVYLKIHKLKSYDLSCELMGILKNNSDCCNISSGQNIKSFIEEYPYNTKIIKGKLSTIAHYVTSYKRSIIDKEPSVIFDFDGTKFYLWKIEA